MYSIMLLSEGKKNHLCFILIVLHNFNYVIQFTRRINVIQFTLSVALAVCIYGTQKYFIILWPVNKNHLLCILIYSGLWETTVHSIF